MAPAVKFCGLTRPADAAFAGEIGARYVGAIFADSPRRVDPAGAREVYSAAGCGRDSAPEAVAVFGDADGEEIVRVAHAAGATVVQLHGLFASAVAPRVRELFAGEVWVVAPVEPTRRVSLDAVAVADAVVLDTADATRLGGTGRRFDWESVAAALPPSGRSRKVVLAGGLRPSNVGDAIRLLLPDVVDVSSGVESSPGIKSHALMRAFMEAVADTERR